MPGIFHPHHKRLRIGERNISFLIIDGYNLIGVHHKDLEAQRERLVALLIGYKKRKGHDIVVIFDGWKAGAGTESASIRGGVKVVYSRLGEKADSVIKRMLSSFKREWTVVSSDREIAAYAWATGSVPVRAEQFLPFLEPMVRAVETSSGLPLPGKDEEEEEEGGSGKGSPRQLSKKEKMVKRALGKL